MTNDLTRPLRPGTRAARKSLDFVWICDTSGSMAGRRIESLNQAGENALDAMRRQAAVNYGARISVRMLAFDEEVRWIVGERTPVAQFEWTALQARPGRLSSIGSALLEIANQFSPETFEEPALAPILVLLSDGFTLTLPGGPTLEDGLTAIAQTRPGQVSLRYAVAIGGERRTDALEAFVGKPFADTRVLHASRTSELGAIMAWVSSVPINTSSQPATGDAPPPRSVQSNDDDWIS